MNARDLALLMIDREHLPLWHNGLVPRHHASATADDPRDLALAEQIFAGTVKNLLLCRHLIQHYSGRPLKSIDPLVQKVLAIGLYQLRFLDRIPASAAVDEAVEQTRRMGRTKASGFVNAVLRRATREPNPPLPTSDDPERYAEIVLSHPRELFRKLAQLLGVEVALRFCEHDNRESPLIVRLLPGHAKDELLEPDLHVTPHQQPGMFVIKGAKRAVIRQWSEAAIAQPQDPTAAQVVEHCDIHPGQAVLDRCSGMGTKTMQIRERLGDSGAIVAIDPAAHRVEALQDLARRRGAHNLRVHCVSMLSGVASQLPERFDRVLADVPCSNSGVLARRPAARFRQDNKTLQSLRQLQLNILADTAPWVAQGGKLIYSTCSVWPEENEDVVQWFLQSHPDYRMVHQYATAPSMTDDPASYHDGGYVAVLLRNG